MTLLLLRHTRPAVAEGVCYGRLDLEPAETFEAEAEAALAPLAPPGRIVTSPLRRCRALADRAGRRFGRPVSVAPDLAEMDFGRWEGQRWDDIPRHELDAWAAAFDTAAPHGGETVAAFRARVAAALDAEQARGPALVVTHAGVMKVALWRAGAPDPWRRSVPFGATLADG